MKYIIYLVIGLIAITLLAPEVKFENIKSKESTITKTVIEPVGATESVETVNTPIEPPKAKEWAEMTVEEKIKANPNKCDLSTQVMYEDGSCHNTVAPTSAISGGGDCEASIRRIFPASEHARAIKVMIQESSRNPAIHNYNPSTGDDSYGCFQINLAGNNKYSRPSPAELVIAENNVAFAYKLWQSTGWCSTGGWLNTGYKVGIC